MSTHAKEYCWVFVVSILILAFGTLPIIAGYAAQTPEQRFVGTFFDKQDYAVHMAMINYGEQGGWGTNYGSPLSHIRLLMCAFFMSFSAIWGVGFTFPPPFCIRQPG